MRKDGDRRKLYVGVMVGIVLLLGLGLAFSSRYGWGHDPHV